MRLTTKGRFAVTAMIDLALQQDTGPVSLAGISQRQNISLSYLEQLFSKLRRHELVESVRGPGGGYFRDSDMILAMDWDNMSLLQQQCPRQYAHKIQLMMRYATEHDEATVPDPYYGGPDGFDTVLNYIEDSCTGLLEVLRKRVFQFAAA